MTDVLTRIGLRRMSSRNPSESHRVATPLELLFDLVFVVAVAQASQNLHHLISDHHVGQGVLSYLMVFFAIWWAWMNFTWFASAFDTDDWLYRMMTIVQMAGVLVLAAGIHAAMVDFDFLLVTWGYVIMRLAMVGQWLRAARAGEPPQAGVSASAALRRHCLAGCRSSHERIVPFTSSRASCCTKCPAFGAITMVVSCATFSQVPACPADSNAVSFMP